MMTRRGVVTFPCTAFMLNATVRLIAMPERGPNFTKTFLPDELGFITGLGQPRTSTSVGEQDDVNNARRGEGYRRRHDVKP
jgi:hypothetical protein